MKIKSSILTVFAVLFVFCGAALTARAQDGQMVGGYSKTDPADAEVKAAAKFAVKKRSQTTKSGITLLAIKQAATQVVAGLNFDICMQVSFKRGSKKKDTQFVEVVVYRNLKNVFSLTSWTAKQCTE